MQSAGEICLVCERPVVSELDADSCRHCHSVFHAACLESVEQTCAHCGGQCDGAAPGVAAEPTDNSSSDPAWMFAESGFQRSRTSLLYRLSLMLVMMGMILLPLLYVALIGLCALGVVAYAVQFSGLLGTIQYGVPGFFGLLFFYIAPLLTGTLLVLFLIKPLFAPQPPARESFSLNHADAPKLFALIGSLCRSLNAPIPSRVDVDCSVNAGAGFRGGFRSIFDNDIALCVGLPLVAGLNLNQFAGVLAHEYGHFSQGAAMRAHYVIRCINGWFYRAVYERDRWDAVLGSLSEPDTTPLRIVLVVLVARTGIAVGRGILWVLMILGNLLSSFMSRQMEFDADQYELKLSGSDAFISTVLRLQQLNLGLELGQKQLVAKWKKEKKLYDQIPDFIVGRANEISAEMQERHYATALKRKTRLFDSHPSDAERIARARSSRERGVFHETAPATVLFADYPGLSRRLTLFFYRNLAGAEFKPELLAPTEQASGREDHDYAADRENIRKSFLGVATELRPIIIREKMSLVFRREETLRDEIQSCRRSMQESAGVAREAFEEFTTAGKRQMQARQAAQLLDAGFQFDPTEFDLFDNNAEAAETDAEEKLRAADAVLRPFETAIQCRLADLVLLLRLPQIAAQIPNAVKLQDEAKEMIWVLSRMGDFFESLLDLRQDCAMLEVLLTYRRSQPLADNITGSLEGISTSIQERLNSVQEHTRQMRYPFCSATEQVLISDYARNKEYHSDPFELALREGRSQVEKLLNLYCRVLNRLVEICDETERTAFL